jgi:hypothetical protein
MVVFFLVLMINVSVVTGLSISPPESTAARATTVERRVFVSKTFAYLPLIIAGLENCNAADGYEDGLRGLKYKVRSVDLVFLDGVDSFG